MSESQEQKNKFIVLEAFETLFNQRDYGKAANFWSLKYIHQCSHSARSRWSFRVDQPLQSTRERRIRAIDPGPPVTFLPHGRAPQNLVEEFTKSALTRNGDKGKV